jgi:hypothetical protein
VTYRKNPHRRDQIARFGQEAGLPLFEVGAIDESPLPKAIADGRDTRKAAHMDVTSDQRKLSATRQKVLDAFRAIGPATNEEAAHHLGWPINRISGRSFELRERGFLVEDRKRTCRITGNNVHTWRVK